MDRERAFKQLHNFVKKSLNPLSVQLSSAASPDDEAERQLAETRKLLARCYLKLGAWQEQLLGLQEANIPTVLGYYRQATEHDSSWYKAWHSWAVMNFETVLFYKLSSSGLSPAHISMYGVPALQGFVRSIALSSGSSLQDTLRLLTLMFNYGHNNDMYEALNHRRCNFYEESIALDTANNTLLLMIEHGLCTPCLCHGNHIPAQLCFLATSGIESLKMTFLKELV